MDHMAEVGELLHLCLYKVLSLLLHWTPFTLVLDDSVIELGGGRGGSSFIKEEDDGLYLILMCIHVS